MQSAAVAIKCCLSVRIVYCDKTTKATITLKSRPTTNVSTYSMVSLATKFQGQSFDGGWSNQGAVVGLVLAMLYLGALVTICNTRSYVVLTFDLCKSRSSGLDIRVKTTSTVTEQFLFRWGATFRSCQSYQSTCYIMRIR